jgi:hypothetical protein
MEDYSSIDTENPSVEEPQSQPVHEAWHEPDESLLKRCMSAAAAMVRVAFTGQQ